MRECATWLSLRVCGNLVWELEIVRVFISKHLAWHLPSEVFAFPCVAAAIIASPIDLSSIRDGASDASNSPLTAATPYIPSSLAISLLDTLTTVDSLIQESAQVVDFVRRVPFE